MTADHAGGDGPVLVDIRFASESNVEALWIMKNSMQALSKGVDTTSTPRTLHMFVEVEILPSFARCRGGVDGVIGNVFDFVF